MSDREKVIKGLECCTARNGTCQYKQEPICPYVEHCQKEDYAALQRDALAMLKEHDSVEPDPTEHIVFGTNTKCSNCGKYLFPAGEFCPHCGRLVKLE